MDCLTKDSKKLLKRLCKEYKTRKKTRSEEMAKKFGSAKELAAYLGTPDSWKSIEHSCLRLEKAGFLFLRKYDDGVNGTYLTDKAIAFMENRFSRALKAIWKFLLELLQLVPNLRK